MRTFNIKTPDKKIVPALQDKIDNLTKPKGSLGRLEELAVRIGTIQQSLSPVLRTPQKYCGLQPTMVWLSKESAFLPRK